MCKCVKNIIDALNKRMSVDRQKDAPRAQAHIHTHTHSLKLPMRDAIVGMIYERHIRIGFFFSLC